jgi:hypothetical protein
MGMYLETLTLEECIGARTHNSSVRLMVINLNHSTTIVTILRIIERREMYDHDGPLYRYIGRMLSIK